MTVKTAYGPRVDLSNLENLYAPQTVKPYTPPPPGIDNLGITSTDTFMVPGIGEVMVDFKGYVRVARSRPSVADWTGAEVYTNLLEMCMCGQSREVGPIIVTLNQDFLSAGRLGTPFADRDREQPAKSCRMAVAVLFELPQMGMTLFNKEPILLTIDNVRAIPPAGNPGEGRIYELLPLYNLANPEGEPMAYITGLKFAMGTYITEEEIQALSLAK